MVPTVVLSRHRYPHLMITIETPKYREDNALCLVVINLYICCQMMSLMSPVWPLAHFLDPGCHWNCWLKIASPPQSICLRSWEQVHTMSYNTDYAIWHGCLVSCISTTTTIYTPISYCVCHHTSFLVYLVEYNTKDLTSRRKSFLANRSMSYLKREEII